MVKQAFLLLGCFGCGSAKEGEVLSIEDTQSPSVEHLSVTAQLVRASIDTRGVRPSVSELKIIAADPNALGAMVDAFVDDPRWAAQVRDMYGYTYLTRTEGYFTLGQAVGLDSAQELGPFTSAMGEEALRILSTVADEDLPWTTIVTADWTMANEQTAMALPVDYPVGETGWKRAHYTDGRPTAGVLSGTNMWIRFTSTVSNFNRGRANAISRLLLCNDYLEREIELDRSLNLIDAEATAEAIKSNPGCNACHSSLDPLGSNLFGFMHMHDGAIELTTYHGERENWWKYGTQAAPALFGTPTQGLSGLGTAIAADPRFRSCAVEQVFSGLVEAPSIEDTDRLLTHLADFEAGGLTLRALVRSVLRSAAYRGETGVMSKMVRSEQYASQIEDLTGYRMTYVDYDLLQSDLIGIRLLAGGGDGVNVTQAPINLNATMALAHERIAEAAAWTVLAADRAALLDGGTPRLFTHLNPTDVRAQIEYLHQRVLSHEPAEHIAAIDDSEALFSELMAISDDPEAAWSALLSALFRDPDFLFY